MTSPDDGDAVPEPALNAPLPLTDVLANYLVRTRWFSGKGRPFEVSDVKIVGELPGREEMSPHVVIHLAEVTYADGHTGPDGSPETELYQVPLAFYAEPQGRLDHAFVGWWQDAERGWIHAYDALHDREAMACWLRSFHAASATPTLHYSGPDPSNPTSALVFHRLPGYDLDTETHSTLFSGEQSNSSVAFGEDALMKVFRKVTPGVNPDIQIHEVLTNAGSEHIAALYGWLDVVLTPGATSGTDEASTTSWTTIQLAMLQRFFRTATDGWELAQSSVRNLFAEPDVHANASGGDFAGEATRLGEAVADVHRVLAEHFPTERRGPEATEALARTLAHRLDRAVGIVPELAEHADALRVLFDAVGELEELDVQRIHGDLHLGQTLRTSLGWKLVDFEGEPAKPLHERLLADSPWRDVAGMLRSFDYAPQATLHAQSANLSEQEHEQLAQRALEWANRARNHFLTGYAFEQQGALTPAQRTLLTAYVADKAVYETVYETRNRPTWVEIPLQAVARISAA